MTGSWQEAQAKLQADALKNTWRPFKIARIAQESSTVRSFYLAAADGHALAHFEAGQHLPVRLTLAGETRPSIRTYTLSCAPSDGFYRLSIKLDGHFSQHMHSQMQIGDLIEARAPQGDFVIDALARRPAVLLAAGIGVTPMLAMLRQIVFEGVRKRRVRPSYFFYSVRHNAERAFEPELAELAQRTNGAVKLLRVTSAPEAGSIQGKDYDVAGRIDIALLKSTLPFDDYDFYLCGPQPFMQSLYDALRSLNIADERIHAESFGPSGLQRQASQANNPPGLAPIAKTDVQVLFSASGKEARWLQGSGSLLELAEQRGLEPEFSCRGGSCGTCRTRVEAGKVSYLSAPAFHCQPDEALLCCAMPAEGESKIVLKL
jgi:ferredoxin-NADP reductase